MVFHNINVENETIARLGTSCLQLFIINNHAHFANKEWESISQLIVYLFKHTTANKLFLNFQHLKTIEAPSPMSPNSEDGDLLLFQQVISQCVLQLLLIHVIDDVLKVDGMMERIELQHLVMMCDCLESSWEFAHKFNEDETLRYNLWKAGFMKQRPNLHKQETTSIMCLINILLRIAKQHAEIEERCGHVIERLITTYLTIEQNSERKGKNAVKPAIELVLDYFIGSDEALFDRIGKNMYKSFVLIARMESDDIMRSKVCDVLDRYMIYL